MSLNRPDKAPSPKRSTLRACPLVRENNVTVTVHMLAVLQNAPAAWGLSCWRLLLLTIHAASQVSRLQFISPVESSPSSHAQTLIKGINAYFFTRHRCHLEFSAPASALGLRLASTATWTHCGRPHIPSQCNSPCRESNSRIGKRRIGLPLGTLLNPRIVNFLDPCFRCLVCGTG